MPLLPLHGYDGLPPLSPSSGLTAWEANPVVIAGLVVAGGLYLWASLRLRRRGDHWSVGRMIAFLGGGLGTIALATLWWPGAYDDTLFWAHMVQHMTLSMVSPIFLALGAPVTLALRTLPAGPRQGLVRVLHSLPAKIVMNPLVGFALLFGTPFVLYFTGLYEATLRNSVLHEWLHVHFIVAGCVFFWPLIGVDPVPGRLPHPMRLLLLFVTLPAHAWLGISIMSQHTVLAGDYYRALARPWGPSLLHDQSIGGGLMWATGDLIGLIVVAALFVQWARADAREAVRTDRAFDRAAGLAGQREADETDAWTAYNARLAALARHEAGTS
ncbi:MAG TPA: cytochrome c oxidase assembly protein [Mycobacteriales bacterium]|nr:cytochrome c oxidase assembly protein [Mycobacteriales bacterium]